MNHNNDILEELAKLAPALIPLQKTQVYSVPNGYFEGFSAQVMGDIRLEHSEVLPMPQDLMTVPEGYFQNFAESVLQKIKTSGINSAQEEIKQLSPALSATGNDNIFTVPNSYFKDLPGIIVSQVQKPARVITMKTRSSFARYAAAAVITGLLGLATFSIFNDTSEPVNATALAMMDAQKIIQTNSFDRVMETVSDEEIVGFLQSEGHDVEAALVASSIDSKELPAADEYIINENTLNNYLESLDISSPN